MYKITLTIVENGNKKRVRLKSEVSNELFDDMKKDKDGEIRKIVGGELVEAIMNRWEEKYPQDFK